MAALLDSLWGLDEQAAALLARDPAAHAPLDNPGAVASLLESLLATWRGGWEQATRLLARDPAAHAALDNPYAVASLLDILMDIWPQPVGYEQAAALAARAAAHVALNDRDGVLKLLRTLRKASATDLRAAGVHEQAAVLAARLSATPPPTPPSTTRGP